MKKMQVVCVIAVIATAGISQAAITINTSMTDPQEVIGVGSISDGAAMAGMTVTVNGGSAVTWTAWGPNFGGASSGSDWSIQAGSTGSGVWTLTSTAGDGYAGLDTLLIDAGPGNTVFDIKSDLERTTGSGIGAALSEPSSEVNWTVDYWGPVSLSGQPFANDLYRYMKITTAGDWTGTDFTFKADTDPITPVPAPGALLLAGLGSGVVGFIRRRQWA